MNVKIIVYTDIKTMTIIAHKNKNVTMIIRKNINMILIEHVFKMLKHA